MVLGSSENINENTHTSLHSDTLAQNRNQTDFAAAGFKCFHFFFYRFTINLSLRPPGRGFAAIKLILHHRNCTRNVAKTQDTTSRTYSQTPDAISHNGIKHLKHLNSHKTVAEDKREYWIHPEFILVSVRSHAHKKNS